MTDAEKRLLVQVNTLEQLLARRGDEIIAWKHFVAGLCDAYNLGDFERVSAMVLRLQDMLAVIRLQDEHLKGGDNDDGDTADKEGKQRAILRQMIYHTFSAHQQLGMLLGLAGKKWSHEYDIQAALKKVNDVDSALRSELSASYRPKLRLRIPPSEA